MRGLALAVLIAGVLAPPVVAQQTPGPQPLYLQADQLIYDTRGQRVIAQGAVEMYFNNYIATADELVYEQGSGKLTAKGNAVLKEPDGNVTRADVLQFPPEFVDAFTASLKLNETEPRFAVPPK